MDSYKKTLATPAVRRLAQEYNVKLSSIQGSGKDGRVLKEDILNHIESHSDRVMVTEKSQVQQPERMRPSKFNSEEEETTEPITGVRKAMFKTMTQSNSIPQFQLSDEIDMTNMIALKSFLKEISSTKDVPIKPLSFFIKSTSLALKSYRILNSSVTNNDTITHKKQHNIGFAMDTPTGLLVPNIKSVQDLSIVEISRELARLQEAGIKGQLSPSDLNNGTFTISNIGSVSRSDLISVFQNVLTHFA